MVGKLDWEEALDGLSLEQFRLWRALDEIEGIGWKRDDMRGAHHLAWLLASSGNIKEIPFEKLRHDLDACEER